LVDWDRLYVDWDKVPEEQKKKITSLLRELPRDKLAELFRKEPAAANIYQEHVEEFSKVRVKMKVEAGKDPGELFGTIVYDTFEAAFFLSPTIEAMKRTLTYPEEVEPIDKRADLEMAEFSEKEIEEELKTFPWPFNTGVPITVTWTYPEDVEFSPAAKEVWDIYHRTYKREDLELMKIDELKFILRIKRLSTTGGKEELISRILGVPPPVAPPVAAPPAAPPPVAPPPKPPVKPPVPLVPEKGLAKADEKRLLTRFEALLLERTIAPPRWRPMFEDALYDWREALKDLPRDEAVSKAFSEVERLVGRIMELAKPPKPPVAAPPLKPPEEVPPTVPPMMIAPPIPPPTGIMREWGMPWAYFLCPAHLGEGVEVLVMRSPYLETRLISLGVPTRDSLFFELCEEHRRKYGGAFEHFPRDTIEFWVGEAVAKAEVDIAVLVAMGISEDYVHHCVRFYNENKQLAVQ